MVRPGLGIPDPKSVGPPERTLDGTTPRSPYLRGPPTGSQTNRNFTRHWSEGSHGRVTVLPHTPTLTSTVVFGPSSCLYQSLPCGPVSTGPVVHPVGFPRSPTPTLGWFPRTVGPVLSRPLPRRETGSLGRNPSGTRDWSRGGDRAVEQKGEPGEGPKDRYGSGVGREGTR